MSRIAYLIGESGAGKSTLCKRLKEAIPLEVLTGDLVLKQAAGLVEPVAPDGQEMDPGLWLQRAIAPELPAAIRNVIFERLPIFKQSRLPVLAEATLFCIRGVLEALHRAVHELRPDIVEARIFCLDVSAETLVSNISGRKREERKIDANEARTRLTFFNEQMEQHGPVWRGDYNQTARKLRRYLAEASPATSRHLGRSPQRG